MPKKETEKVAVKITLRKLVESGKSLAVIRRVKTEKVFDEKKNFKESVISLKTKLQVGRATEQAWGELVAFDKLKGDLFKECAEEVNHGTPEKPQMELELVPDSKGAKRFEKEINEALDTVIELDITPIPFSDFEEMGFDADLDSEMLMHLSYILDFDK